MIIPPLDFVKSIEEKNRYKANVANWNWGQNWGEAWKACEFDSLAPVTPLVNLSFLNLRDSLRNGVSSNGSKLNLRIDRPLDAAFKVKRQVANDLCEVWQPAAAGF